MAECKLCSRQFSVISNTHLRARHATTIAEYKKQFGGEGVGFAESIANIPHDDPRYQEWRRSLTKRPPVWNKGHTKETHPSAAKISRTFKKKKIDNFARWREEAKQNGIIKSEYPPLERNSDLAFLIGMVLGDGNLQKFPRTELLVITLGTDKPKLWKHTAEIVHSVFEKHPKIHKRKQSACVDLKLYQNQLSQRLGIPIGARGSTVIRFPKWIWEKDEFLIPCLRGLFEAEGSLSIHKRTYTYNLSFANKNASLLEEVARAVEYLGFHPERRTYATRLRKKQEVFAFKQLISFRMYG